MIRTYSTVSEMSISEIREAMREDGYETTADRTTAATIKEAAKSGSLLWTKARITTTDRSRLDIRPAAWE